MKKYVVSLLLGLSCVSVLACQVGGGLPGSTTPEPVPSFLPGGSLEQDPASPLAQSMKVTAQNLLNQEFPEAGLELQDILSFKTQVVAGTLFHLVFRYQNKAQKTGQVRVTIYKDLDGNTSLDSHDYSD